VVLAHSCEVTSQERIMQPVCSIAPQSLRQFKSARPMYVGCIQWIVDLGCLDFAMAGNRNIGPYSHCDLCGNIFGSYVFKWSFIVNIRNGTPSDERTFHLLASPLTKSFVVG
jgi:hypothetical protein